MVIDCQPIIKSCIPPLYITFTWVLTPTSFLTSLCSKRRETGNSRCTSLLFKYLLPCEKKPCKEKYVKEYTGAMYWIVHIENMNMRVLSYSDNQVCTTSRDSLWVFTVQTVISQVGNIFLQCFLKRSGLILVSAKSLPSDSAFFSCQHFSFKSQNTISLNSFSSAYVFTSFTL